jgi:ABC-type sugar transport system substrate-binding protein
MFHKVRGAGGVAVLAAVAVGITGCGSSGSSSPSPTSSASGSGGSSGSSTGTASQTSRQGGHLIAYLQPLAADPSVQAVAAGLMCEAKKTGDTIRLFDAGFDQNTQISQFNTALAEGAKGIISHPVNAAAVSPLYSKAAAQHVPVIQYPYPSSPKGSFAVNGDPSDTAQVTIKAIQQQFPHGAKVVMIDGPPTVAGVLPRQNAFIAAARAAGIPIVGTQTSLTLAASDVNQKTSSLLLHYPDANVIWAITAATAGAAGQTAQSQHKALGTKLITIGAGASSAVAADVRQGTLTDMIEVANYPEGEAMVSAMDQLIAGKTNPTVSTEHATDYTKANISSWVPPQQRCKS